MDRINFAGSPPVFLSFSPVTLCPNRPLPFLPPFARLIDISERAKLI